jgi:hypothetical protein
MTQFFKAQLLILNIQEYYNCLNIQPNVRNNLNWLLHNLILNFESL